MNVSEQKTSAQNRKVLIFENAYTLSEYLLQRWIEIAQESVERRNRFTLALSGGRSPMEFYCKLAKMTDFDLWSRTHIFMGDERFVAFDHERSNFKMIKEYILDYVPIPRENIHPIATDQKNVDIAAEHYKDELAQFFDFKESNAPCFDFILLGIGVDGHTASLFANDPNIDDPKRIVLPVSVPQLKEERVSLALPVINNARNVFTLVMGAPKSDVFTQIMSGKSELPASKVDLTDGVSYYLLDNEAARKLTIHDPYKHEGLGIVYEPAN